MDEKCKRLIDVLRVLKKNTQPVPWLSNPESVDDGWKITEELLNAISEALHERYERRQ